MGRLKFEMHRLGDNRNFWSMWEKIKSLFHVQL